MSSIYYCTLKDNKTYDGLFISSYSYQLKRGYGPNIIHPTDILSLKKSLEIITCKNHPKGPLQPFTNNAITCVIDSYNNTHPQDIINLVLSHGIPNFTKYIKGFYTILIKYANNTYIFKDPSGFKPLYVGFNKSYDIVTISSEIKAIPKLNNTTVYTFPNGYYWSKKSHSFIKLPKLSTTTTTLLTPVPYFNQTKKSPEVTLINGDIPSIVLHHLIENNKENTFYTLNYISNDKGEEGISPNPNVEYSKIMAEKLNFKLVTQSFSLNDITSNIENIIICLETCDTEAIKIAIPLYIFLYKINNTKIHHVLNTTHGWPNDYENNSKTPLIIDKLCGYFNFTPNLNFYTNNIQMNEEIKNKKINGKKLEKILFQIIGRTPQDYSEDWLKELINFVSKKENGKSLQEFYKDIYTKHFYFKTP